MDVKMPDGTVIQNVPDGTTRDQLVQKLQVNGMSIPKEWLAEKGGEKGATATTSSDPVDDAVEDAMASATPYGSQGLAVARAIGKGEEWLSEKSGNAATTVGNLGTPDVSNKTGGYQQIVKNAKSEAVTRTAGEVIPDLVAIGIPGGVESKAAAKAPEALAREFVSSRTMLDWDSLGAAFKQRLTDIAKKSGDLSKLDPKAVERQAHLESLPVPVKTTRGKLTRDAAELRNEANVAATAAGKPIRDIDVQSNRDLQKNLEVLKGKVQGTGSTAGKAASAEQTGLSVQDQALRPKALLAKKNIDTLYDKARAAGEMQGPVDAKPILDFIKGSVDPDEYAYATKFLKGKGAGEKPITLDELEKLRQDAVAKASAGGSEGHYAGQLIKTIDAAEEGAGGQAFKAARKARKDYATEFEEPGAIDRLVSNKSRTDRATALEDTWRQVVKGGSLEDLDKVKRTLLTGGDAKTRTAGRVAWRDIKAETVDRILADATKGSATNEAGERVLSPASLEKAINGIGRQKLESILGKSNTDQIYKILEAVKMVRTDPSIRNAGSSTVQNLLTALEKAIPGGKYVGGAARAVKSMGEAPAAARRAASSPLDDAGGNMLKNVGRGAVQGARAAVLGGTLLQDVPPQ